MSDTLRLFDDGLSDVPQARLAQLGGAMPVCVPETKPISRSPEGSVARCTCAIDVAAIRRGSNVVRRLRQLGPRYAIRMRLNCWGGMK
nr:hypothetical protein [uncultured Thioclava sp.]